MFNVQYLIADVASCDMDTCVGLSSGTAGLYRSGMKEIGKENLFASYRVNDPQYNAIFFNIIVPKDVTGCSLKIFSTLFTLSQDKTAF